MRNSRKPYLARDERPLPFNNTSGYMNVSQSPSGKRWVGNIRRGDKVHHIGTFDTPEEADEAVRKFLTNYEANK